MKKALLWVKDHYYIPLFVLAVILFWVIFRKKGTPIELTRRELEAIEAGRRARELEERLGTTQAKIKILTEYHEAVAALDEEQQAKAKELGNDPQKLAKFLVRAGARNN